MRSAMLVLLGVGPLVGCDLLGPSRTPPATTVVHDDAWRLGAPLDGLRELSGLTRQDDDFFLAQNRVREGPQAQVFRVSPSGEIFECTGQWSVQGPGEPWVDAEAITTSGRGTLLLLVEATEGDSHAKIWELELPEPASEPRPAIVAHRWRLDAVWADAGGGSEAIARVPAPTELDDGDPGPWVLVGHQARAALGLFHLRDDVADDETLSPVRTIATDFRDTSSLYFEEGSLYLWHNETEPTPYCRERGGRVNVLERYRWSADEVPTALRGSTDRWKHPQADDSPCYDLEGIALGPCEADGGRWLYLVNDEARPHSAHRHRLEGFCP